jgi:excisionase family DNA binding protein
MMKMNKSSYKAYDDLPLMLSVPEVAKVLGISRAGAYELARSREFPSMKVGSRIIIPKDKFLLWIEKQCGEGWHPPRGTGEMYE